MQLYARPRSVKSLMWNVFIWTRCSKLFLITSDTTCGRVSPQVETVTGRGLALMCREVQRPSEGHDSRGQLSASPVFSPYLPCPRLPVAWAPLLPVQGVSGSVGALQGQPLSPPSPDNYTSLTSAAFPLLPKYSPNASTVNTCVVPRTRLLGRTRCVLTHTHTNKP